MNSINTLLVEDNPIDFSLENLLKSEGYAHLKSSYEESTHTLIKEIKPNIIIFNLNTLAESTLLDLKKLSAFKALPIIIFSREASSEAIELAIKLDISELFINHDKPASIKSIINIAISRFNHQQALRSELEEALEKLENRKLTDRAKAILIKTQNFSEDEAYHTLRKLAMDRKITLGEMAKNVIAMSELFK